VSVYISDSHSTAADELVRSGLQPSFTPLHSAEWTHAVAQQVFRGKMSEQDAQLIYRELENDLVAGLWQRMAIPEHAFDLCADLARRYGSTIGVRTLDSLHVACALELKAEHFWTFDEGQAKLARAQGLKTS
jgi:predicted nucleic acid-binding protein